MNPGAFLLAALIPIHGIVLATESDRSAIVRNAPVPQMLAPQTRRYRLDPYVAFPPETAIDAYVDTSTRPWSLREVVAAEAFVPGLPIAGRVVPVDLGGRLPTAMLVDQRAAPVQLARAFAGRTLLLSFIFTRCPDRTLCPAISGKFAYLQAHLDSARFALAEISIDPAYDSPEVLRAYGSIYGARATDWSLLTGEGSTIARLLDQFGISSLRVSGSNFVHSDRLFVVAPDGRVASIVETAGWDPEAVAAEARQVAGLASNPFERFKLSLVADVVAICGGSQWAGVVLLELALFAVIVCLVSAGLWFVARTLWGKPS